MVNTPALIQRVESARGPDRELDAAIFNALPDPAYPQIAFKENNCNKLREWGRDVRCHDGWFVRRADNENDKYPGDLPRLSSSLDAAVSLCARLGKDGFSLELKTDMGAVFADVGLFDKERGWSHGRSSERGTMSFTTPALALVLAVLRAVETR